MKRRRMLLAAGVVLLTALAVFLWARGREPAYQGKPIRQWILETHRATSGAPEEGTSPEKDALRHVLYVTRSNTLPFLLHQFTVRESRVAANLRAFIATLTRSSNRVDSVTRALALGHIGLRYMGSNALPALPVLAGYVDDPIRGNTAVAAMNCCGAAAIPFLQKAAASTNQASALYAVYTLGRMAVQHESAISALVQLTTLTNVLVRQIAVHSLFNVKGRPDLTVPVFVRALSDTDAQLRNGALQSLAGLGPAARPAIPALRQMLTNENHGIWFAANKALREIDPAALDAPDP